MSEVNADLKRLVATYNASHGTAATTNFSVHSDMAPNVYIAGNPARDSATARTLEQAMSDMEVTNPYSGDQQNLFVAMADPIEENLLHMVTADPARTPTFTPFAQGDYFLNGSSTTPCANNDLNACLTTAVSNPNQSFAWNHGGIQPEIRSTWIGWVGPGIENLKEDDGPAPIAQDNDPGKQPFTDHTDIRPTMLALLGLKDTYVSDGRVVTEILKGDVTPKGLNGKKAEELGQAYKQIMASFGDFSLDTLTASTGALASTSSGDSVYTDIENQLQQLGQDRDGVTDQIRLALWNAEFNGQKLDEKQVKGWIDQADDLLGRARELAASSNSESRPEAAREDQALRRHLRGEPLLRQPVRGLGGRKRPERRSPDGRRRPRHAGRPERRTRTAASSSSTSTSPRRRSRTRARTRRTGSRRATSRTRTSRSTTSSSRRTSRARRSRMRSDSRTGSTRTTRRRGRGRAAAPATWCTSTTRSSTSFTAACRTAT